MIKIGFWAKDSKNKYFCNICPHCGAVMFIEKETEVSKNENK